ncbi:MAG: hypothetical protein H7Z14_07070 [Anaerolineae bacterium]|nr:hypothetical protein [Phycisphaerae bacterium]
MGLFAFVARTARISFRLSFRAIALTLSVALLSSCSMTTGTTDTQWVRHRSLIDFSGLKALESIPTVKASIAPPIGWERIAPRPSRLYSHEQWRSPSGHTGVGVAYIRMPIPLGAGTLAWFAKQEYGKKSEDGKVIAQWTDSLDRTWFEVQNKKYHVRGYVTTRGLDAWIIYSGYRRASTPDPMELSVAQRSVETIAPIMNPPQSAPTTQPRVVRR